MIKMQRQGSFSATPFTISVQMSEGSSFGSYPVSCVPLITLVITPRVQLALTCVRYRQAIADSYVNPEKTFFVSPQTRNEINIKYFVQNNYNLELLTIVYYLELFINRLWRDGKSKKNMLVIAEFCSLQPNVCSL